MIKISKIYSPKGSAVIDVHGYQMDKDNRRVFTVIGQDNVKDKVKAALKGSTLYEMIEKYQKTGDDSFLMQKAGAFYQDITSLPKNLMELYNIKSTCADDFYKMPVDYRALFNHNVDDYFTAIKDKKIEDITKKYLEERGKQLPQPKKEEGEGEVKKDE